jgi:RecA-family ATPase
MALAPEQLQRWYIQSKDLDDFRLSHVTLERQIKMSGAKLVVLDTLGYFLLPGDENSSKDWKEFVMEPLRYLKRKYDCAFILIHHEGKPAEGRVGHHRGRGTSAMFGDCDTWMSLEKRNFSDDDLLLIRETEGEDKYDRVLRERRLIWSKSKVGKFPSPIILDFDFDNAVFNRKEYAERVNIKRTPAKRYAGGSGESGNSVPMAAPRLPDPEDPFGG